MIIIVVRTSLYDKYQTVFKNRCQDLSQNNQIGLFITFTHYIIRVHLLGCGRENKGYIQSSGFHFYLPKKHWAIIYNH